METKTRIKELFRVIDKMDTPGFTAYLTDNVYFRFGNMPALEGRNNVSELIQGFYDSIKALSHDVDNIWESGEMVFCNGTVHYTRHDSTTLSVPFANIFKMVGDRVGEYLIYVDTSELYNQK